MFPRSLSVAPVIFAGSVMACMASCASAPVHTGQEQVPQGQVIETPVALIDSLTDRLAELEIDRVRASVRYTPASSVLRNLDARVASTLELLAASNSSAATSRAALLSVLKQLDSRQAALSDRHRQLLDKYTPTSPMITVVVAEATQLATRRAELRAALGVAPIVGSRE